MHHLEGQSGEDGMASMRDEVCMHNDSTGKQLVDPVPGTNTSHVHLPLLDAMWAALLQSSFANPIGLFAHSATGASQGIISAVRHLFHPRLELELELALELAHLGWSCHASRLVRF